MTARRYTIWHYTKTTWLVCYDYKPDYCVSIHRSKRAAENAVKRYEAADQRRDQ